MTWLLSCTIRLITWSISRSCSVAQAYKHEPIKMSVRSHFRQIPEFHSPPSGIAVDPTKIRGIIELPPPKNLLKSKVTKLPAFIHNFISNLSKRYNASPGSWRRMRPSKGMKNAKRRSTILKHISRCQLSWPVYQRETLDEPWCYTSPLWTAPLLPD